MRTQNKFIIYSLCFEFEERKEKNFCHWYWNLKRDGSQKPWDILHLRTNFITLGVVPRSPSLESLELIN